MLYFFILEVMINVMNMMGDSVVWTRL